MVTYAKEQIGVKRGECGPLGLRWNKDSDAIAVTFPQEVIAATKREARVALTMAKVRETHWVPRLRQLVKRLSKRCYGCKRFHVVAYSNPPPGNLPQDHTVGTTPFQVVGVDYADPVQ